MYVISFMIILIMTILYTLTTEKQNNSYLELLVSNKSL